jgi:hypothetical protein
MRKLARLLHIYRNGRCAAGRWAIGSVRLESLVLWRELTGDLLLSPCHTDSNLSRPKVSEVGKAHSLGHHDAGLGLRLLAGG